MRSRTQFILVGAAAITVLLVWNFLAAPGEEPGDDSRRGAATALAPGAAAAPGMADPGGGVPPAGWNAGQTDVEGASSGATARSGNAAVDLALISIPATPDDPLARVDGVALTVTDVFPPGSMHLSDKLPKETLLKFVDEAVKRRILVQEAERRGFAAEPEFIENIAMIRKEINALPNISPEEKEWQVEEIRGMALADRLFREEGIVNRRMDPKDLESYYRTHSAEYDWARKREAVKGSTPEKIERRVKKEMQRDLESPGKRETRQKREKYTDSLRQGSRIEILF